MVLQELGSKMPLNTLMTTKRAQHSYYKRKCNNHITKVLGLSSLTVCLLIWMHQSYYLVGWLFYMLAWKEQVCFLEIYNSNLDCVWLLCMMMLLFTLRAFWLTICCYVPEDLWISAFLLVLRFAPIPAFFYTMFAKNYHFTCYFCLLFLRKPTGNFGLLPGLMLEKKGAWHQYCYSICSIESYMETCITQSQPPRDYRYAVIYVWRKQRKWKLCA